MSFGMIDKDMLDKCRYIKKAKMIESGQFMHSSKIVNEAVDAAEMATDICAHKCDQLWNLG